MKGYLDQFFALEPADRSAADSKQLRVPTLDERVELYLRAVYGTHEVTREKYLRARNLVLDAMAAHFKDNSVASSANKPAGLVDIAAAGRTISSTDETMSWASSQSYETAPQQELALRYYALEEKLAAPIHFDETPGAPSARPFVAKDTKEARAPLRQRHISGLLSSLTPRTIAWSATAAAVAILVPAAVITSVVLKQQNSPSELSLALPSTSVESPPLASLGTKADRLPRGTELRPDVTVQDIQTAFSAAQASREAKTSAGVGARPTPATAARASSPDRQAALKLSDEEIAALVARGRALIGADDIRAARLVLEQAAEAGHAAAAFELGATYDPAILQRLRAPTASVVQDVTVPVADIAMARAWYEKARALGSTEAAERLQTLTSAGGATPR